MEIESRESIESIGPSDKSIIRSDELEYRNYSAATIQ